MSRRPYSVYHPYRKNRQEEAERILIALINAGADLCASTDSGLTISEAARICGNLPLWAKALKKCGYDYWKDQPPGILNTGNMIELATDTEDMDSDEEMNSDEGVDSNTVVDSDIDVDSDNDVNSDEDIESE